MNDSPFDAPQSPQVPLAGTGDAPQVVTWYRVYCGLMTLLYIACFVGGIFLAFSGLLDGPAGPDAQALKIQGWILLVISVPLTALFAAGVVLPPRPWTWIYGFVPICIGMTSCCILPFSIGLIVFWIKPDTKRYFGRE